MKKLAVALVVLSAGLAGCAPKYSCKNFPTGSCKNMSQVYDATGEGFSDYREKPLTDGADKKQGVGAPIVIGETVASLNALQPGDHIMTRPQHLKILFTPWEDRDRDLNYSYVFIRVRDAEWTVLK